jgi:hypothetical protein
MSIDAVDIGGASRVGVPKIPEYRNADGRDEDESELMTEPTRQTQEIPLEVQKAVAPGAQVAYPQEHPAVTSGLALDAGGRMLAPKGSAVVKSLLTHERVGPRTTANREGRKQELDQLLAEEKEPEDQNFARSATGVPVIEVIFQTEIGAIVGYFHKVVQQGEWLILLTDNRAPAQAKFIPQPRQNDDGNWMMFDLIITGSDKKPERLRVKPLGMQFTVENYDFIVMSIED